MSYQLYQPIKYFEKSSSFVLCEGNLYTSGLPHIPNILWAVELDFSQMNLSSWVHSMLVFLADMLEKCFYKMVS
jgi:hypothetical protein